MSKEFDIDKIIKQKNDEINRKFLFSINGNTELYDKPEEIDELPELKELNINIKDFISSLDKEGFFKNNKMKIEIERKVLMLINNQNSQLNKIVKSMEFNFFFDLVKPYLLELMKNYKEKGGQIDKA